MQPEEGYASYETASSVVLYLPALLTENQNVGNTKLFYLETFPLPSWQGHPSCISLGCPLAEAALILQLSLEKGQHGTLVFVSAQEQLWLPELLSVSGDPPSGSGDRNWWFGVHQSSGFGCVSYVAVVLSGNVYLLLGKQE